MAFALRNRQEVDSDQFAQMLEHSPAKAAQAILAAAGQEVVEAQLLLGQILLDGRGIEKDPELARRWFFIAATLGSVMADNMLGRCWEHGWGGDVSHTQAAKHYRQAAHAGLDWGMYNYANMLATGRGVGQDHAAALAWYRQAAELGHAKSMNLLGRYLEEGECCPRDVAAARHWYQCSAEAGDFRGQFSHAGVLAAQGLTQEALEWLQQALAGGNENFLRIAGPALEQAEHVEVRNMAVAYRTRLAQLQAER
ncbi:tetratricopeptide repeat protein [Pseudomonas sp. DG56-2]|uniref:tetratricopeptide repeat protein n=1 Tax=Pseudomonas sp. DG56-2 TaxID=2320270 RepID=UPI0010A67F26|nr:tetratricopeptide repeat protein [Pseudomonas sp. DG56-2]